LISLITVSLNSLDTISQCIESVIDQDISAEHIIIDGGSSSDTLAIIESYRNRLSHVLSEPDQGIYDAMNKGIKLASGTVIGILNADDYYPSRDVLSRIIEVFEDPEVQACYGDLAYVDIDNTDKIVRYWEAGNYNPKKLYYGWMPPHPTFFVRASVYEKFGFFNLDLGSAADYEIMLRFLLKHRINVEYVPMVMVHMRTGGVSNVKVSNRLAANLMDRKAWEVNELRPYPWTLYAKPLRKVWQWWKAEERMKNSQG
jgi:glycosyltransferase involved in cell wall biosynthesis